MCVQGMPFAFVVRISYIRCVSLELSQANARIRIRIKTKSRIRARTKVSPRTKINSWTKTPPSPVQSSPKYLRPSPRGHAIGACAVRRNPHLCVPGTAFSGMFEFV